MNIFVEMAHAVYDPKCYASFLKNKKSKTFLYGVLLATLYFLVAAVAPYGMFVLKTGGVARFLEKTLPDFTLSDGKVSVEKTFQLDDGRTYVYVNTRDYTMDEAEVRKMLDDYDSILVMDARQMAVLENGRFQIVSFDTLGDITLTKASLMGFLRPYIFITAAIIFLVMFLWMQAGLFLGALFVALFGMLLASLMNANVTFGQLYQMGIYSRTTPLLLKALVSLLPFGIPFFWLLSLGISLYYISEGIHGVRYSTAG